MMSMRRPARSCARWRRRSSEAGSAHWRSSRMRISSFASARSRSSARCAPARRALPASAVHRPASGTARAGCPRPSGQRRKQSRHGPYGRRLHQIVTAADQQRVRRGGARAAVGERERRLADARLAAEQDELPVARIRARGQRSRRIARSSSRSTSGVAGIRYVVDRRYHRTNSLRLTIGGSALE